METKGRPPELEIKEAIPKALQELVMANPIRIAKKVTEMLNRPKSVHWATINRYLDELEKEGIVRKQLITQGKKRNIYVYSLIVPQVVREYEKTVFEMGDPGVSR